MQINKMYNGEWIVSNRNGEQFKISVKKELIPSPSVFAGEIVCNIMDRNTFCLCRKEMCCPEYINIKKSHPNYLIFTESGVAKEIWERDVEEEKRKKIVKDKVQQVVMQK